MKTIKKHIFLIFALSVFATLPVKAQTYSIVHSFGGMSNVTGFNPRAPLIQGPDSTFYGTTEDSQVGFGSVFKFQPDGMGFGVVKVFTNYSAEGAYPFAGLVLSGSTLYGTTFQGGSSDYGTVFKVNIDGSGIAVLKHFAGTNGAWPCAGLVLSDNVLYGTTSEGGTSAGFFFAGYGTVFKVNTDGTGFTVLKNFDGPFSDGAFPCADLMLSGNTLYGTAADGSFRSGGQGGTVFKISTDGSGYAVLKRFINSLEGANPYAGLVLSGNTLYGTTYYGGSYDNGTVFKLNTDGSGFAVLKNLSFADGINPGGNLLLSGITLYGTTTGYGSGQGSLEPGTVFRVNTNGSGFTVLREFTWEAGDGAEPFAGLLLAGNRLYGTCYSDFFWDHGTVFSLSLTPLLVPTLLPNGDFRLSFTGFPSNSYSIEASTNLVSWTALTNFVSGIGNNQFIDSDAPGFKRRFYRAVTP